MNYGFVIDNARCIGCHACSTACKSENQVPLGVYRTWVKSVEVGRFPDVRRSFQVTRCNHCDDAPCVRICPTAAMHSGPTGSSTSPPTPASGARPASRPARTTRSTSTRVPHRGEVQLLRPSDHVGLEPACVVVCPEHAIIAGDLDDPKSEIPRVLGRSAVTVRKPEQGTKPKLFYIEGQSCARPDDRPPPGVGLRCSPPPPPIGEPSGRASARLRVSYDVHHKQQWHWPIPAYTRHQARRRRGVLPAGVAVPSAAAPTSRVMLDGAAASALIALAMTSGCWSTTSTARPVLLPAHPPQWRSWMVRGSVDPDRVRGLATGWWGRGGGAGRVGAGLGAGRPAGAGGPRRRRWRCWPRSTPRSCSPRPRAGTCGRPRTSRR